MPARGRPGDPRVISLRRLAALDDDLLVRASASRSPARDRLLRTAGRAANRSGLWLAGAAVLGLAGGSRGRRAALRGLTGIAITSTLVNGPLKYALRRGRPAPVLRGRASLIAMPGSFSFPSGHAASAFAFATGVARVWPVLGVPLAAAAATVAYSRVHTGVHFPSDVIAGAGLGVAAGLVAGRLLDDDPGIPLPPPEPVAVPRRAVLLASPHSGSADGLEQAAAALHELGIEIVDRIPIDELDRLGEVVRLPERSRPLVIAAGGDGTVGAAADRLAGTGTVLGVLPLGTSNDVARSLGIPPEPVAAARHLARGVVRSVDVGQVTVDGGPTRHFVHAATAGMNVHFAELATRSSLRRRFGRFTYAVAGVQALRRHQPFECELRYGERTERLCLAQLSIVNAPVFGGALDLRVPRARMDDRSLVVIAVEQGSPVRLLAGAALNVLGRRDTRGIRALRTTQLHVHVERSLDVALDGEITATLPADFEVAADALRVVTPRLPGDRA